MLMNRVETALINSAPRRWLQRGYEVPWLRRLGGTLPPDAHVLEIGCGPGYGTPHPAALRRRPRQRL